MGAAPFMLGLLDILGKVPDVAAKLLDLALDPSFNEGLSPSSGLAVTPLVFSSIDPEGHWKLKEWGYNDAREFMSPLISHIDSSTNTRVANEDDRGKTISSPGAAPINFRPSSATGAATKFGWGKLISIDIPKPPKTYDFLTPILALLTGPAGAAAPELAKMTILQEAHAEITASWEHDGLEVWGGFAGLEVAWGFLSTFGHRAKIDLLGTPYGNYLPGAYMICMTGHVNPVGPKFYEFRCAAIVQAGQEGGKGIQPLWGTQWERESGTEKDLRFTQKAGFILDINPY
jgi:hypothetical protein